MLVCTPRRQPLQYVTQLMLTDCAGCECGHLVELFPGMMAVGFEGALTSFPSLLPDYFARW